MSQESGELSGQDSPCFHCGVLTDATISTVLNEKNCQFCCYGCLAVAQSIVDGGLSAFYEFRDKNNIRVSQVEQSYDCFDLPAVQDDFVEIVPSNSKSSEDEKKRARLIVDGISCAACIWLIEKKLLSLPGVASVQLNSTSHRANIVWQHNKIKLSQIMQAIHDIGYVAKPNTRAQAQLLLETNHKQALVRLGLAGFGMMQAGMVAVALHAGDIQGIDQHWQAVLRWLSLLLTAPVFIFCGSVFFKSALRALRQCSLNMDVPVSLALILAFSASAYATTLNEGDVYFDSVCMFIFFLLAGRFLEQRLRFNNSRSYSGLDDLLPISVQAKKKGCSQFKAMALKQLELGDEVLVAAGSVFPIDGLVLEGHSSANEAILSGETIPLDKSPGCSVVAGSINGDTQLTIRVDAVGESTQLSAIERWSEAAADQKPLQVCTADKLARHFVLAVLVLALCTYSAWFFIDRSNAFWITLSVLVVTCPCALSLATPTVFTAALSWARRKGVLLTSSQNWQLFSEIDDIVFDKTGTLTKGTFVIRELKIVSGEMSESKVLSICAAIEQHSKHPIANAFSYTLTLGKSIRGESEFIINEDKSITAVNVKSIAGKGLVAKIEGDKYGLGSTSLIEETRLLSYPSAGLWILLSKNHKAVAWVKLEDKVRDDAFETISALKLRGKALHILSGDRKENVNSLSMNLNIENWKAEQKPNDKLDYVRALQKQGRKVLMLGDGINDAPVLGGADVSLSMANGTQLAQTMSDGVLMHNQLSRLPELLDKSAEVKKKVQQNLIWALSYNFAALPLAAFGFIPPWAAAIGMSVSSIVVVVNALSVTKDI